MAIESVNIIRVAGCNEIWHIMYCITTSSQWWLTMPVSRASGNSTSTTLKVPSGTAWHFLMPDINILQYTILLICITFICNDKIYTSRPVASGNFWLSLVMHYATIVFNAWYLSRFYAMTKATKRRTKHLIISGWVTWCNTWLFYSTLDMRNSRPQWRWTMHIE